MNLRSRRIAGVLAGLVASVLVGTGTASAWDAYPGSTGSGSVSGGKVNITLTNRINQPISCEYNLWPLGEYATVAQVSGGYGAARAAFKAGDVRKLEARLAFPGRIAREKWVAQAKALDKQ